MQQCQWHRDKCAVFHLLIHKFLFLRAHGLKTTLSTPLSYSVAMSHLPDLLHHSSRCLNVVSLMFPTCYSLLHIFALILPLKQSSWIRKRQAPRQTVLGDLFKGRAASSRIECFSGSSSHSRCLQVATRPVFLPTEWFFSADFSCLNLASLLFSLWCQLLQSLLEWSLQENMPTRKIVMLPNPFPSCF